MTTTVAGTRRPRKPSLLGKIVRIALFVVLVAAAVAVGLGIGRFLSADSRMSDSQIYQSVQRQEKVALLALGIQGIAREEADGQVLGVAVPAGDRTTLIQYQFTAQVGIDGAGVEVEGSDEESTFRVSIPEFIFIGYDDPHFEDPIESNGPLSFLTTEIEVTRMVNNILSDEKQQSYIDDHKQILRDQAQAYYTGIIKSIDPDANVTFTCAD